MKDILNIKVNLAKNIIFTAVQKWPKTLAVSFKGGKDSMVILDILKKENIKLPLFFIDHGYHFNETYKFIRKVKNDFGFEVYYEAEPNMLRVIKSIKNKSELRDKLPIFKVNTIKYALIKNRWNGLVVAIRKDENEARKNENYFILKDGHWRIHPLLDFTEEDIWNYIKRNNVIYNPLYDKNYRSFEDKVFSKKVSYLDSDERSGREQNKEKIMHRLREMGYF